MPTEGTHYSVGGSDSLPLDLTDLCMRMVTAQNTSWKYGAQGLKRITEGQLTYEWGSATAFGVHGLPDDLEAVIARYARRFAE